MLAFHHRRWQRIAALCAVWCLLAPTAAANIGLPMLAVVWPVSWVLFVPIVLVEAFVCARVLPVGYPKALWMVSVANAISTLVGIPLTWILLVLIQSALPGRHSVDGTEASLGNLLVVVNRASWLSPSEPVPPWIVPVAALVLCVPFFFVSVWVEGMIVRRTAPESVAGRAFRSSWRANLATYGPIGLTLSILAWTAALSSTPHAAGSLAELHGEERAASPSLAEAPPPEARAEPRSESPQAPAPSFFVRVLRAPGGEPIDYASFTAAKPRGAALARALQADDAPTLSVVRAHGQGLFELLLDPVLTPAICVRAPGWSSRAMLVEGGHARPEDAAKVALERPSAIAVRLSGGSEHDLDGARLRVRTPVRGLLVAVPDSEAPDLAEASWTAESDALGRAELAGLPARVPLDLTVERDGVCIHRRVEPIVLEPDERREIEVVLGAASAVLGRMIDEHDAPLPDREVWLVEVDPRFLDAFDSGTRPLERATTGPDGTFRFDAVREGSWRIGPAFVRRDAVREEEPIRADVVRFDVGARSEPIEVTLRALRGSFVSGVVLDEEERPVADCVVHVDPSSASRTWTRSDSRGEFKIGPLASGVHQLVAGSAGVGKWSESPPLDVLAGTRGVVLRVSVGAALRGRLVDADGREQAEGRIEVTQVEGGEMPAAWAMTVNRGHFDLAGLSAGTYDVFAVARGARACSARVELRAGEQRELELRLEAGATLAVENQTDEDVTVELRAGGRLLGLHPLARAASQRWTVPAGALEVTTRDPEQRRLTTQALELRPAEERALVLPPR